MTKKDYVNNVVGENWAKSAAKAADRETDSFIEAIRKHEAVPEVQKPEDYGEKYASLREQIIHEGEVVATRFQDLSERYAKMAAKVREDVVKHADTHITELKHLDKLKHAVDRRDT